MCYVPPLQPTSSPKSQRRLLPPQSQVEGKAEEVLDNGRHVCCAHVKFDMTSPSGGGGATACAAGAAG